jgi:Flp pilus assembly secretin CpaC
MLGLLQHRDFAKLDAELTAAVRSVRLTRYLPDYADYLSIPVSQREQSVPRVIAEAASSKSQPHCGVNRKLDLTVGVGRMLAFPVRLKGVVVSQASESLALLPVSLPYIMSSILLSPMSAGDTGLYLFDRNQKCRVHYAVSIHDDSSRRSALPPEWTAETKPVPTTMEQAKVESTNLEAAIVAGHLKTGNPVDGIAMAPDASIWVSDPRIVDTIEMRPPPTAKNGTLALIAKHPGTTTVAVIDPDGGGHAYRVEVTPKSMRVLGTDLGQYESGI